MERYELYEKLRALHVAKLGFVMPNAWDGVSGLLIKKAGFQAVETSAAAFSFSLGVPVGVGAVSRSEEIDNAVTIGTLTGLPVNGDFENGFGFSPEDCVATVEAAIEAGIAGLSIDDATNDPLQPVHDFDAASS
jgi:2-methylisocitrate lyase-like PEP mutase family enzyme